MFYTIPNTSILLLSLVVLSSCSFVTERDCVDANWSNEGVRDGMSHTQGIKSNKFAKTCKTKFNVLVDENEYNTGYQAGIKSSCSHKSAFRQGLNNRTYNIKKCSLEVMPIVLQAYYDGKVAYLRNKDEMVTKQFIAIERSLMDFESALKREKTASPELNRKFESLKNGIIEQSRTMKRNHLL